MRLLDLNIDIKDDKYESYYSYSFLSKFAKLGRNIINYEFKPTVSTTLGSLTDDILSYDINYILKKYHIANNILGESVLKTLIDDIILEIQEKVININDIDLLKKVISDIIINRRIEVYYPNYKLESRVDKILKEGYDYIKELYLSRDKIVVNSELYNEANQYATTIKTHDFTKRYFQENKNIETVNQFSGVSNIELEIDGKKITLDFKYIIDKLIIDHDKKEAQIIDYKILEGSFITKYFSFRYDLQAYLYQNAIEKLLKKYYPAYVLLPFKFIYLNKKKSSSCLVIEVSNKTLKKVENDYEYENYKLTGIKTLIKDFNWFKSNNFEVEYPESIYINNGN